LKRTPRLLAAAILSTAFLRPASQALAGAQAERMLEDRARARAAAKLSLFEDSVSDAEIDAALSLKPDLALAAGPEPSLSLGAVAMAELASNEHKWPGFAKNDEAGASGILVELAADPDVWRESN